MYIDTYTILHHIIGMYNYYLSFIIIRPYECYIRFINTEHEGEVIINLDIAQVGIL